MTLQKEWCDPSVPVTTHPPWESISTDSKRTGRSRWKISNIKFLSEHLLDLTKRKLSPGKEQNLSSLVSGVIFLQKYCLLEEYTWYWWMLVFRIKVLILAVWFSAELTNTRVEVKPPGYPELQYKFLFPAHVAWKQIFELRHERLDSAGYIEMFSGIWGILEYLSHINVYGWVSSKGKHWFSEKIDVWSPSRYPRPLQMALDLCVQ